MPTKKRAGKKVEKNPFETHLWSEVNNLTVCVSCWIVKRHDGKNKPCKGPSTITTRGLARCPAL